MQALLEIYAIKQSEREKIMEFFKDLTDPYTLAKLCAVCSVASYAITEVSKPFTKYFCKDLDLRKGIVRLLACLLGAIAGYEMTRKTFGAWVGFGCGALNAYIVSLIKTKLKKLSNTDSADVKIPSQKKAKDEETDT